METAIDAFKKLLVILSLSVTTTPSLDVMTTHYIKPLLEERLVIEEYRDTYGLKPYEEVEPTFRDVRFTNYYVGDSTGSGVNTSVGLTTTSFGVNSKGWYTYKGRVVIATATSLCLEVKSGPCGSYNSVPEGYKVNDLWDEVEIEVDGTIYQAVVLDSCGACFWDEERQRVDIFVTDRGKFGNINGGIND